MTELQNFVNNFGFGISVENLVHRAYRHMDGLGYDTCVLNERYTIVDGQSYQFIKSRKANAWVVRAF